MNQGRLFETDRTPDAEPPGGGAARDAAEHPLLAELGRHLRAAKSEREKSLLLSDYGWWFLERLRKPREAYEVARRMLENSPRDVEGLCLTGHASIALGRTDEAEGALADARLLVHGPSKEFQEHVRCGTKTTRTSTLDSSLSSPRAQEPNR